MKQVGRALFYIQNSTFLKAYAYQPNETQNILFDISYSLIKRQKPKPTTMKKLLKSLLAILLVAAITISFAFTSKDSEAESEVKELVLKSYVNGAFNELDAAAMIKGFHEDFAIYSPRGEAISKYPIAAWADGVAKRKNDNYDASDPKNKWEHKFAIVDVTGHAAQVKIELLNQGKHVYTDYLSLLRFNSGWRIVAKVFQEH